MESCLGWQCPSWQCSTSSSAFLTSFHPFFLFSPLTPQFQMMLQNLLFHGFFFLPDEVCCWCSIALFIIFTVFISSTIFHFFMIFDFCMICISLLNFSFFPCIFFLFLLSSVSVFSFSLLSFLKTIILNFLSGYSYSSITLGVTYWKITVFRWCCHVSLVVVFIFSCSFQPCIAVFTSEEAITSSSM